MAAHLEWVHAEHASMGLLHPNEIEMLADDGNDDEDWGIFVGDEDGAVLYGPLETIEHALEKALSKVRDQIGGV